ncbi:hypothetical protein JKF63_03916 [Porcisia hertigi]|uniref:Uncharacterized protein n=1 Tax=Porcisia hertigi TaxID=2761500 RepID=A0A836IHC4_9TRYP|nr:hypothetical protein JKF63_03916 [Porcisia hertigi]
MMSSNDTLAIILLWLVYVSMHICFDHFERRAARRIEEREAREYAQAAAARLEEQQSRSRHGTAASENPTSPIAVIVLGAEGDTRININEPCEGAVVPDANGQMPVLPEQVQYGEATYTNRQESAVAAGPEKPL